MSRKTSHLSHRSFTTSHSLIQCSARCEPTRLDSAQKKRRFISLLLSLRRLTAHSPRVFVFRFAIPTRTRAGQQPRRSTGTVVVYCQASGSGKFSVGRRALTSNHVSTYYSPYSGSQLPLRPSILAAHNIPVHSLNIISWIRRTPQSPT